MMSLDITCRHSTLATAGLRAGVSASVLDTFLLSLALRHETGRTFTVLRDVAFRRPSQPATFPVSRPNSSVVEPTPPTSDIVAYVFDMGSMCHIVTGLAAVERKYWIVMFRDRT